MKSILEEALVKKKKLDPCILSVKCMKADNGTMVNHCCMTDTTYSVFFLINSKNTLSSNVCYGPQRVFTNDARFPGAKECLLERVTRAR